MKKMNSLYGWRLSENNESDRESKIKRLFDILLSSVGILFFSPLWLLFSLTICLEGRRPIFYAQKRMGKNNRIFVMYKFRSMVQDTENMTGAVWAS
tara:strand:+ start:973 stop:1260 length:288 start_codon:yes stop_codon:yes gene_type:complete